MKTATFIRKIDKWRGGARLYKLSEPMSRGDVTFNFVIVSAVNVPYSGPETYIFPAKEDGIEIDMLELDGSFRGEMNHAKALKNAGYSIVIPPIEQA